MKAIKLKPLHPMTDCTVNQGTCTYLRKLFTFEPNFYLNSRVHSSLHFYSHHQIVVPHVLFYLGIEKNYSAKLCLYFHSCTVTSIDHWVPRMLFVHLINQTRCLFRTSFSQYFWDSSIYVETNIRLGKYLGATLYTIGHYQLWCRAFHLTISKQLS